MTKSNGINIEVLGDYRITSDTMGVIIHRKIIVDPTKSPNWAKREAEGASPELRASWTVLSYHPTVEQAMHRIAEQCIRECGAQTFEELLSEMRRIRREISDILAVRV